MITFIGVGTMGGGMAMNLVRAGHPLRAVTGHNIDRLEPFRAAGALTSIDPADAVDSEYIFLCLPDLPTVRAVLFGEKGIVPLLSPGQTVIDCSTIEYLDAKAMGEELEALGIRYLDAPVSGHQTKAADGTLTIMAGGPEEVFRDVLPLFRCMGTTILRMGGYGAGQLAKMINNCVMNICIASFCELMPLGVKLGLEPEQLGTVLMNASGASNASRMLIPEILQGKFDHGFTMDSAYKDMVSLSAASARCAVPLPTFQGTMQTYQAALQQGFGGDYKGAMIRVYEELLGVECRAAKTDFAEGTPR